QDVGLVRNVVDQADDVTDLLGRFTQPLDPLGGVLDLFTDDVHAGNGALHHLVALVGNGYRTLRYRGRFGGVGRYLVDGHRHLVDRRGRAGNLLGLVFGCLGQVHGRALGFLGSHGHLGRRVVDGLYQGAELLDGEVDGVGNSPGKVLGYCRLGGQVTIGPVGDLVEQAQNRRLVTLVGGGGFSQALARFAGHLQADQQDAAQRDDTQQIAEQGVDPARVAALLEPGGQIGDVVQQHLGVGEDVVRRQAHLVQLRGGHQDLVHRVRHEAEQVGNFGETANRIGVGHLG